MNDNLPEVHKEVGNTNEELFDGPIDRVYVGWANSLDSAGQDSSQVRERLLTGAIIDEIAATGTDVLKAAERADKLKKYLYYGKPYDKVPDADSLPLALADQIRDGLMYHNIIRLYHAILGLVGEAGELMEQMGTALISGKPIDGTNIDEEAGDCLWYMALIAKFRGYTTFDNFMVGNRAKLTARYGTSWNQDGALNRDTDGEMLALEGAIQEDPDVVKEDYNINPDFNWDHFDSATLANELRTQLLIGRYKSVNGKSVEDPNNVVMSLATELLKRLAIPSSTGPAADSNG